MAGIAIWMFIIRTAGFSTTPRSRARCLVSASVSKPGGIMKKLLAALAIAVWIALGSFAIVPDTAMAGGAAQIDSDVDAALASLYANNPAAKTLGAQARGILVFPWVLKAGLLIG